MPATHNNHQAIYSYQGRQPSAWDHVRQAVDKPLLQVSDQVHVAAGRSGAGMTFIQGPQGVVVVDNFLDPASTAQALHQYLKQTGRQQGQSEIMALVLSYPYLDSFDGIAPILEAASAELQIIIPAGTQLSSELTASSQLISIAGQPVSMTLAGLAFDFVPVAGRACTTRLLYCLPALNIGNMPASWLS